MASAGTKPPTYASIKEMRTPPEFPAERRRLLQARLMEIWRAPVNSGAAWERNSVGDLWDLAVADQDSFSHSTDGRLYELPVSIPLAHPPRTRGEIVDAICVRHDLRVSLDAHGCLKLEGTGSRPSDR